MAAKPELEKQKTLPLRKQMPRKHSGKITDLLEPACGLSISLTPRGLSRIQAAAYIGVSPSKFDGLVASKRMPGAKIVDARKIWDRLALDIAFSFLPEGDDKASSNPWDEVDV